MLICVKRSTINLPCNRKTTDQKSILISKGAFQIMVDAIVSVKYCTPLLPAMNDQQQVEVFAFSSWASLTSLHCNETDDDDYERGRRFVGIVPGPGPKPPIITLNLLPLDQDSSALRTLHCYRLRLLPTQRGLWSKRWAKPSQQNEVSCGSQFVRCTLLLFCCGRLNG